MKNFHLIFIIFTILSSKAYAQAGINTTTPESTLDIVASSSVTSNNVLEVSNPTVSNIFNVDIDGNINITSALKPNDISGKNGDVLISQGSNTPPIWKKSIVDYPTIEIFSAQRNEISSTVVAIKEYRVLDFPNINTLPIEEIGAWSSTNNTFTVNKKGIFHISAGLDAINLNTNTNNLALHISTSLRSQTASGVNYLFDGKNNYSTNTTLSLILNPGNTIRLTGNSGSTSWQQGSSFISILYSELP